MMEGINELTESINRLESELKKEQSADDSGMWVNLIGDKWWTI